MDYKTRTYSDSQKMHYVQFEEHNIIFFKKNLEIT